jgi:hypothetical protein
MIKRPNYFVVSNLTSASDDDCEITVRRNGKIFYIQISPINFRNSPCNSAQYLKYLEVLRSGEEEIDEIYEDDVYDWATQPFEPLFIELAPDVTPAPVSNRGGNQRPTLHDYLFPEWFILSLEAVDDKVVPRQIQAKCSGHMTPGVWLPDDFLDDLETWIPAFTPKEVELCYAKPEDMLNKMPQKVLINVGN